MGVINRKIDPNRRLQRQHPYDVYRALLALRLRDQALGQEEAFYTPEDIARVLYINYDDLLSRDRERVLYFKLDCALRCLKNTCFVEEHTVSSRVNDYLGHLTDIVRIGQNTYRASSNVFNISGWTRQQTLDATRDGLDRDWGIYIGRRGPRLIDYGGYPG